MSQKPKILDVEWRSGRDTVGIVAIETFGKRWEAYIGVSRSLDELTDIEAIAAHGAKLPWNEAVAFFPHLKKEDYAS